MITLKQVDAVKGGRRLFQKLNWTISSGQNWVITGDNGSGKTLLLELLAGLVHIPSGNINYDFIKGSTWQERYEDIRKKIHYIPAHAIATFAKNGSDLFYQQRYYKLDDTGGVLVKDLLGSQLDKASELTRSSNFDLHSLLDVEMTRLSNGQLKKMLILKNLLTDLPKLLMLDYPYEGLDADSRGDLNKFLDFLSWTHAIQILLVDNHHHLPECINHKLTLCNFSILKEEAVAGFSLPPTGHPRVNDNGPPNGSGVPLVEIRNLTIQYDHKTIIQNFNWTVHPGERWALTGRNGSGKTTLFSLIFADHPQAYSQEIYLFGRRRGTGESIWDIKRRINYIGPELMSYMNLSAISLTARDYVKSLHSTVNEEKLEELIDFFDVPSFREIPVKFLSSGQQQLMMIIGGFLADKELLLLDEPFQFLDPQMKAKVQAYLQSRLSEQQTLILITHYEEDLLRWTRFVKRM